MKKRVCLGMAIVILLTVLTACGNHDEALPPQNNGSGAEAGGREESDGARSEQVEALAGIGTNDADSLKDVLANAGENTEAVKKQYAAAILEAFQNLDEESLKPFLNEEDYLEVATVFTAIKEVPEDVEVWNQTIGTMIYLPGSDILIGKSCDYVTAKWYTDCWKNNEELPADESVGFPKEYLEAIYENYYKDAPYLMLKYDFSKIVGIHEDGSLCYTSSLFDALGIDFKFYSYKPEELRATVILNQEKFFNFGYEYIAEDIPGYEALMSKDLDKMLEIVEGCDDWEDMKNRYQDYLLNADARAAIQTFFNEECEVYRNVSQIMFYFLVDVDKVGFYSHVFTEEDKETVRQLEEGFVHWGGFIGKFPEHLYNNFPYSEMIDYAKDFGIVE